MTRTPMTQAVAADYADAMLVGRRAKNVLFLLLALVLLSQLAIFFVARYVHAIQIRADVTTTTEAASTSTSGAQVNVMDKNPSTPSANARLSAPAFEYVIAVTDYAGILLSIVLSVVLLLIIIIMLVGRLVGVAHVTGAFCWSVVFIVLLFPWQSLLNSQAGGQGLYSAASATTQPSTASPTDYSRDIRIPGVLYTFPELRHDYDFPNQPLLFAMLKWARFVGFPVAALIILLMVQGRSGRGLRFALGEADIPLDMSAGNIP